MRRILKDKELTTAPFRSEPVLLHSSISCILNMGGNQKEKLVVLTKEEKEKNNELFVKMAESAFRISLASFGGALVGFSLARRHASPVLKRSPVLWGRAALSNDLPKQWANSCATFAFIFESSLWLSPASMLTDNPYLQTIGNFTLGGALAGTIYRGLPVQRNRGPGTIAAPRMSAGIVSGLILGFVPGVLVAGISMLGHYIDVAEAVDEERPEEREAEEPETMEAKKNEKPIAREVKANMDDKEPTALDSIAKTKKNILTWFWTSATKDNEGPVTLEAQATKDEAEPIAPESSARTIVRNQ